ncbi:MAG TPA: T9SS type A sorting domain-containing protein [Candidatus Kapabacteria bacterium]|nr:T9SS type A sorting domain-containing protein [Candidatus Kapabacteria bacterium]
MKKFIIPLLIIFSSLISANLFSQNTITFTIGTIQAIPGQLVSIPISISGANGTNAIGVGQFYIFHTSGITKSGSNVGFTYDSLTNPIEWLGNLNYNSTTISNTWMSSNFNDVSFPDGYILFYINVIYNGPDTVNLTWGTSGITETMVDNSLGTLYGTVNFNFNNGKIIPAPPIPTAPNLLSPANDSTGVSHSPTLSWQASANATIYHVQVSTDSSFSTIQVNDTVTTTSRQLSNLQYSTKYYWRVRAINSSGSSDWSVVWSFMTLSISLPNHWNFTSNTGNYAVIGLNPNGVYEIDNRNITNGDAIGVFYLDESEEKCAGYMIWDGQNYGIVVWGDDDFTQNTKEGFSPGEAYIIKVWDAQEAVEHYVDFNIQSGLGVYQPNGITIIDAIRAIVKITHNIHLNTGWNMISSYVQPNSLSISNLLSPISQKLQIMRNAFGLIYSPPMTATLSQWSRFHAYQLRLTSQDTLPIYGKKITPQALPIFLSTNWYWLPYPRTSSMALTTALSSIQSRILQVKTITGQVYHPPFFYTLQTLEPGKGYMIKLTQFARLVYPPNSTTKSVASRNSFTEPSMFVRKHNITGKTAVIPMEIANIQDGDEVGVFTRDGLLVGAGVWQEGSCGVVVWGDDEFTSEKDGAYEGEELFVKVWSRKDNTIGSLRIAEARNLSEGSLIATLQYETDAILMLKGIAEFENSSLIITPQPAAEELFISYRKLPGETLKIELYNQNGSLLISQVHNSPDGVIKLDIGNIPSGVYFVVLRNGLNYAKERVVVVK